MDIPRILAAIRRDAFSIKKWQTIPDRSLSTHGAESFEGRGARWNLILLRWKVTPTTWGYAGTAARICDDASLPHVVNLMQDAEEFWSVGPGRLEA